MSPGAADNIHCVVTSRRGGFIITESYTRHYYGRKAHYNKCRRCGKPKL